MASGHGVLKPDKANHPNRVPVKQDWHNAPRSDGPGFANVPQAPYFAGEPDAKRAGTKGQPS
jgi:hypothetical protein